MSRFEEIGFTCRVASNTDEGILDDVFSWTENVTPLACVGLNANCDKPFICPRKCEQTHFGGKLVMQPRSAAGVGVRGAVKRFS